MLVGFYVPTDGKLTVDGYDIGVIDKEYCRAQIGYVMQSNLLFSGTIAENIACGDDSPDRRHIEEVAKMADAHAFISKLPLGVNRWWGNAAWACPVGRSRGFALRARLYHDPRLLVFDESDFGAGYTVGEQYPWQYAGDPAWPHGRDHRAPPERYTIMRADQKILAL
ncbi:ATP-binding cassette domain-containing protein [Cupriavidus basilensis]